MLALFFQHGLGYTPLHSGLAVTPFALGTAASAAIAGRLVPRLGRWLTVLGLTTAVLGMVATAVVLRHAGVNAAWSVAVPLLIAGLGSGMLTSPNLTLTLQQVPVATAGAAGGAVQAAQRIGSAIGSATLVGVFYSQLSRGDHAYSPAVSNTLLFAAGLMLLALSLSITDLIRRPRRSIDRDGVVRTSS